MQKQNAVGISPVLLQAINQTLGGSSVEVKDERNNVQEGEREQAQPVTLQQGNDTIVLIHNVEGGESGGQQIVIKYPGESKARNDMNMGSILSAIASHFKHNRKRGAGESLPGEIVYSSASGSQQPLIISMPSSMSHDQSHDMSHDVSHDAHEVSHEDMGDIITETVVTTESPQAKRVRGEYMEYGDVRQEYADSTSEETTYVVDAGSLQEGTLLQTVNEDGTITLSHITPPANPEMMSGPCPICCDRISGYHYGIYTCESCKGFFKRTVQNKKVFHCHKQGDCEINLASRKKCPACRYNRCIEAGMKLEAIREDRMRGGRSSYEGATPATKPKPAFPSRKTYSPRRATPTVRPQPETSQTSQTVVVSTSTGPVYALVDVVHENQPPKGDSRQTLQYLEDLVTLESLMDEDEEEQECCHGKLRPGDDDIFNSLLHIADHCLYKVVRWARNLPEFSSVCTDDQILLLQSCWAELLCLAVCWFSQRGPSQELTLSHGRGVDMTLAEAIGFQDTVQRLLDFTDQLRTLDVDKHEYVALKVLILMNPDVKGLKNADTVREQQERIMESVLLYSMTHYPDNPGKHCHLLARLPELTRTCSITKELLRVRQSSGEIPQYSLLSELLKGDLVVQQAQE